MNNWSRNPSLFLKWSFYQRPVSTKNYCDTYYLKFTVGLPNWPTRYIIIFIQIYIFIYIYIFQQITCAGKCSVRQGVQFAALELHICEFRLRMSDTLAVVSPAAEISLLDGDTVLLEDATRVRDERGGNWLLTHSTQLISRSNRRSRLYRTFSNSNVITC